MTSTTTVAGGANASQVMSSSAVSAQATNHKQLDDAVAQLAERARGFARMPAADKATLLRACMPRIADAAEAWAATGGKA